MEILTESPTIPGTVFESREIPSDVTLVIPLVCRLVERLMARPLPPDTILNVNVPDIADAAQARCRATRLGHRHRAEPVVRDTDPRGRSIYWVGAAGPEADAGPGTDFHTVANSDVSVTPLKVDLTRHRDLPELARWLEQGTG